MKRSLLLSLFAVALVALTCGQALATVSLQLNLRYADPADESEGGTWDLLAKTTDPDGIAGISAVISNINLAGITTNNATLTWEVFESQSLVAGVEIVLGDDLVSLAAGIGSGSGLGNVAVDDLGNAAWNNSALLASGSFGASRPAFVGASTGANEIQAGAAVVATMGTLSVRGDGVASDGLKAGDANRNGTVDGTDFAILAGSWQQTGKTWDQGDFNDSANGLVDGADFALLAGNWQQSRTPPAIAAVPEPASFLLLVGGLALGALRRR